VSIRSLLDKKQAVEFATDLQKWGDAGDPALSELLGGLLPAKLMLAALITRRLPGFPPLASS